MIIADHKLDLTGEAGPDVTLQLDDLDKINGPLVIPDIMLPGIFIFLDELPTLLYDTVQGKEGAFVKRERGGDRTVTTGILSVKMEVAADRCGHVYFIGPVSDLPGGPHPADLFVGLRHGEVRGQKR